MMPMKIEKMFAFIAVDENGNEGIPAKWLGEFFAPLIGTDMDRINSLRRHAQQIADDTGVSMKLVVFDHVKLIEEIKPQSNS